jgi:ABC-type microcin C transport system permease subunit YejB
VISLAGYDKDEVERYFKLFVDYCEEFGKEFVFGDMSLIKEIK